MRFFFDKNGYNLNPALKGKNLDNLVGAMSREVFQTSWFFAKDREGHFYLTEDRKERMPLNLLSKEVSDIVAQSLVEYLDDPQKVSEKALKEDLRVFQLGMLNLVINLSTKARPFWVLWNPWMMKRVYEAIEGFTEVTAGLTIYEGILNRSLDEEVLKLFRFLRDLKLLKAELPDGVHMLFLKLESSQIVHVSQESFERAVVILLKKTGQQLCLALPPEQAYSFIYHAVSPILEGCNQKLKERQAHLLAS